VIPAACPSLSTLRRAAPRRPSAVARRHSRHRARAQAAAGRGRQEAAGVPEVSQGVRGQGRARGGAADQLRHRGRLALPARRAQRRAVALEGSVFETPPNTATSRL
jgi:hypothetical protein